MLNLLRGVEPTTLFILIDDKFSFCESFFLFFSLRLRCVLNVRRRLADRWLYILSTCCEVLVVVKMFRRLRGKNKNVLKTKVEGVRVIFIVTAQNLLIKYFQAVW